jgi:hypothetical protein
MQHLIVSGKLPCTKEECATLAAIHLRIYELNYMKALEEEERKRHEKRMSSLKSQDGDAASRKKSSVSPAAAAASAPPNIETAYTLKPIDNKIIEEDENVSEAEQSSVSAPAPQPSVPSTPIAPEATVKQNEITTVVEGEKEKDKEPAAIITVNNTTGELVPQGKYKI